MADIIDLIRADRRHIVRWTARLGELRRHDSGQDRRALAATWQTLASLIDLHMSAEDEICGPAIFGADPAARAVAREAKDAREDVREIVLETSLQPPGSPRWWQLARTALEAWSGLLDQEEHGPMADYRHGADRARRERLACQWRAFAEVQIRDQHPHAPPQIPTHQLRQDEHSPPGVPRLADPAFGPLACTCQTCTDRLDQA
jgi:hypothetical protein